MANAAVRPHACRVIQSAAQGFTLNLDSGGPLAFIAFQPLFIGIVSIPLWVAGWYYLFRQREWRPLGITALIAYVLFLFAGKAYYPGPVILLLFAAGCVQLEVTARNRHWLRAERGLAIAMFVQAILGLPIGIPLVPQSDLARFGLDTFRKDYADTVGWPELTDPRGVSHRR